MKSTILVAIFTYATSSVFAAPPIIDNRADEACDKQGSLSPQCVGGSEAKSCAVGTVSIQKEQCQNACSGNEDYCAPMTIEWKGQLAGLEPNDTITVKPYGLSGGEDIKVVSGMQMFICTTCPNGRNNVTHAGH